jgi:hypothetical protein
VQLSGQTIKFTLLVVNNTDPEDIENYVINKVFPNPLSISNISDIEWSDVVMENGNTYTISISLDKDIIFLSSSVGEIKPPLKLKPLKSLEYKIE